MLADLVRSAAPLMECTGVATPEEIGAETLLEQLTIELHVNAALVAHPILLSAWATTVQAAPPEQELGYFATAPTPRLPPPQPNFHHAGIEAIASQLRGSFGMLAWVSPQSRGRKSSKPARGKAPSRVVSPASRSCREPDFRRSRDLMVKNLAPLADVAEVPTAYDAEILVSVLAGHLIQAGIPEPNFTRMMLNVIDELHRRDDDHSYPALRTLAVIGPPGVTEYAAAAANRLTAKLGHPALGHPVLAGHRPLGPVLGDDSSDDQTRLRHRPTVPARTFLCPEVRQT